MGYWREKKRFIGGKSKKSTEQNRGAQKGEKKEDFGRGKEVLPPAPIIGEGNVGERSR